MKQNPKLLIIVGVICLVLIVGVLWMHNHGVSGQVRHHANGKQDHQAFDVASGDTNNEVLKGIVARQKALQQSNAQLQAENEALERKAQTAQKSALATAKSHFQQELQSLRQGIEQHFNSQLQTVQSKLQQQEQSHASNSYQVQSPGGQGGPSHEIGTVGDISSGFISDKDKSDFNHYGQDMRHGMDQAKQSLSSLPSDAQYTAKKKVDIPYYTVPDGATAANAALLTPLIAEVPVSGQLQAPAYPFKAIVSDQDVDDMFTANGMPIPPGISGIVLQGYSVGSMSLGCARAYVTKILFVFQNGHFVVYPKEKEGNSSSKATQVYPDNALGYLSDQYGNPCMNGKYITDAPKVIASLASLGAVAGAGGAIAQAQETTLVSAEQSTKLLNGSVGKYAVGYGIGNGAQQALNWYKSRVNDIFDAIFIPSSQHHRPTRMVFNVTKTIPIDLQKNGRTLSYDQASQFSATDTSFE